MRNPRVVLLAGAITATASLAACDKSSGDPAAGSASTTAPPPTSTATAEQKTPAPLDAAALIKSLKCGGPRTTGPCQILSDFKACRPAEKIAPSGDGRWLGNGYVVDDGAFTEELSILRIHRVPLADVSGGQLPLRIAITPMPEDDPAILRQAKKAIGKLGRGDVARKNNSAIKYITERTEWSDTFSIQAEDNQIYVTSEGGAYICELPDQRILVVRRASQRKHAADGLYAVLWPVTW